MPTFQKPPYPESSTPSTSSTASTPSTTFTPITGNNREQHTHSPNLAGWTLLPMRIFLGITFVYAGVQKFADPQFFDQSTPGYIGNQLLAFAHGSPLQDIIISVAVPHAFILGIAIALGEIAIGLGTLLGLLFRPAAFFGLILSLTFFLTASWHVYPYFYGSDIVFAFCWLIMLLHGPVATGYPAWDTRLATKLTPPSQRSGLRSSLRKLLIASPDTPPAVTLPDGDYSATDLHTLSRYGNTQQRMRTIVQKKQEARRNFLLGTITGVSGIVSLGIVGLIANALFSNNQSNATQSTSTPPTDNTQNPSPSTVTGTGSNIAQISAVAKNSATTFTIPSTGDPGVLIHLSNDQFVAYDATCTHAGCRVDYDPGTQHLICPCHGATYDPAQRASVLAGPTITPLTPVAIHVDSATGAITLGS